MDGHNANSSICRCSYVFWPASRFQIFLLQVFHSRPSQPLSNAFTSHLHIHAYFVQNRSEQTNVVITQPFVDITKKFRLTTKILSHPDNYSFRSQNSKQPNNTKSYAKVTWRSKRSKNCWLLNRMHTRLICFSLPWEQSDSQICRS